MLQRPEREAELGPRRDISMAEAVATRQPAECVPVLPPIRSTSSTPRARPGKPKGIVRDNGGHAVALNWSMRHIYDVEPGEVYWAASDVGWVVGHSYIVYGPLLHGYTTVLYEGKPVGTPDPGAFWRVISEHGVSTMFTAPTAFRAIRQQDPEGAHIRRYDLSRFRALFLAGERCDPETLRWAQEQLGVPVIDHWWQTETGWAIAADCIGIEHLPVVPGSPTRPAPGWDLRVLDAGGQELPANQTGALVVKLPLPPGASPTLWNADERFLQTYLSSFPGYYETADAGYIDEAGYVFVMARTDDIINVAGHRLSTGAIEEVMAAHPDVAECAVVGAADELKGQLPVGFLVLKAGVERPHEEIVAEVVQMVRNRIGAVAAFKTATVVDRLPKTRSGKILRATMRTIADGEPYTIPATIDDPAILGEIGEALQEIGYRPKTGSNRCAIGYGDPSERKRMSVVISSAARTAIGEFGRSLRDVPPTELGVNAARAAIDRAGIEPSQVEQVVFGNVIHTAAEDMYMARVVGINAGVPKEAPALTVNRLCGSGLQAIVSAAQAIENGDADVALAGGAESMSRGAYWVRTRAGARGWATCRSSTPSSGA